MAALTMAPLAALAQPPTPARIGVLAIGGLFLSRFEAFRHGMRQLGYVEGRDVVYEYRSADARLERLPDLAADLVRTTPDLIFTASAEAVLATMKASTTIPIVFGSLQDPVSSGVAESLARPGRNATGVSAIAPDLSRKRLELLRDITPGLARVGYLWSPLSKGAAAAAEDVRTTARAMGLQLRSLEVSRLPDVETALAAAVKDRVQGLVTAPDPIVNVQGPVIVTFAARQRLPVVYAAPEHVDAGGLMTYAPNYTEMWRRAATHADRILKGARPANLPIEQPLKFDLVVNVRTARSIGLAIPPLVLVRADRLIE